MSTLCLPAEPNLEHLKAQAKRLQQQFREGEASAVAAVRDLHPRSAELLAAAPARRFARADAQLTLARLYGFPSWARLRAHLEAVERYGRSPHQAAALAGAVDPVGALVRAACLTYGHEDRDRGVHAHTLVEEHPGIGRSSIHAAAVIGDVGAARSLLAADRSLAVAEGGPFRWAPILYAAYSRLVSPDPAHSTLEVARLLLAAGADANTGYLWGGECLFTALTGAFGGGEDDQPPHRHALALARLLLKAGADPNDTQTLYNLGMAGTAHDYVDHLELLIEYGLGRGTGSVWDARLGETPSPNARLLREELLTAALRGLPRRTRLLLEYGVDVDAREPGHPFYGDHTPYQLAVLQGHDEVAQLLLRAGADNALDPIDASVGALMAADRSALDAVLAIDAAAIDRARSANPALVARAAEMGHPEAVRLLVERGWNINAVQRTTALHEAALRGDLDLVRLLLDLGADPDVLDTEFEATPLGWANHSGHEQVVAYLAPRTSPR